MRSTSAVVYADPILPFFLQQQQFLQNSSGSLSEQKTQHKTQQEQARTIHVNIIMLNSKS